MNDARRAEARRLRQETRMSLAELRHHFGVSRDTMADWLWGLPTPEWTQRPNAKDDLRAQAVELRRDGTSVPDIATKLKVSKSTAYLWTRHMPLDPTPEHAVERRRRHMEHMREARWEPHRRVRDAQRASIMSDAAASVGGLSDREVTLLGAMAYWCEGAKSKPWRQLDRLKFINSDPGLLRIFLTFLELSGRDRATLSYRVHIHETSDAEAAGDWWSNELDVPRELFQRPTIKKHKLRTNRINVGADYRGCLVISVPKSLELYWRIEGMMAALTRLG
jgi:hypothetical protein